MWIPALQQLARSNNLVLRGVRELQPHSDVRRKLFSPADSEKSGELVELLEEINAGDRANILDELGDVIYYIAQLAGHGDDSFVAVAEELCSCLGFTPEEATDAVRLKISLRFAFGKNKGIEAEALKKLMSLLPERESDIEKAKTLIFRMMGQGGQV